MRLPWLGLSGVFLILMGSFAQAQTASRIAIESEIPDGDTMSQQFFNKFSLDFSTQPTLYNVVSDESNADFIVRLFVDTTNQSPVYSAVVYNHKLRNVASDKRSCADQDISLCAEVLYGLVSNDIGLAGLFGG